MKTFDRYFEKTLQEKGWFGFYGTLDVVFNVEVLGEKVIVQVVLWVEDEAVWTSAAVGEDLPEVLQAVGIAEA